MSYVYLDPNRNGPVRVGTTPITWGTRPQPTPAPPADAPLVLHQVLADLIARAEVGRVKYGPYLRPGNGRDPLLDAYHEALDLSMYLATALLERDDTPAPQTPQAPGVTPCTTNAAAPPATAEQAAAEPEKPRVSEADEELMRVRRYIEDMPTWGSHEVQQVREWLLTRLTRRRHR